MDDYITRHQQIEQELQKITARVAQIQQYVKSSASAPNQFDIGELAPRLQQIHAALQQQVEEAKQTVTSNETLRTTNATLEKQIESLLQELNQVEQQQTRSITHTTSSSPSVMSSISEPLPNVHFFDQARQAFVAIIIQAAQRVYQVDVSDLSELIHKSITRSKDSAHGELCLPTFIFAKKIKGNPVETANKLASDISSHIKSTPHPIIDKIEPAGPYINIFLNLSFLTSIITHINNGSFLAKRPSAGKTRVMIEYSQPNTHKAFHVGHMRNAALGDCLVRLYEQVGHPVIAANYFGDEGAHIAKCLWYLQRYVEKNGFDIDTIPQEERGEWLGECYSKAVEMLELDVLTKYPYPDVIAAKVEAVADHPNEKAPKNWHQVTLDIGNGKKATVICGGIGYKVGDLVAYMPVGGKWKDGIVTPKDFEGVESHGIMLACTELGIKTEEEKTEVKQQQQPKAKEAGAKPEGKPAAKEKGQVTEKGAKSEPIEKKQKQDKLGEKKEKENKGKPTNKPQATQIIFVLPADLKVGEQLTEQGRLGPRSAKEQGKLPDLELPPAHVKVVDEINSRVQQVRDTLIKMEHSDPKVGALWKKTKVWSLDEFHAIYKWLSCRFDHDFTESEVAEPSKQMVHEFIKQGKVFTNSNGAIGADLSAYGLGFCMVLKSDGSGLYATKDLALAKRKFDEYQIDQSIYVVDAAQTLHFQQVFKTLELMGYERAKLCKHLPYGLVVLPDGKMSSRKGTVILFSQLKSQLNAQIYEEHLKKYENEWSKQEIEEAKHAIAVATIKYGMLNHDVAKDIVFELDKWVAGSGNTGPYMMYQYARIQSIIRKFQASIPAGSSVDYSQLTQPSIRVLLTQILDLWAVIESAHHDNNPSALCSYLFTVSQSFATFYNAVSIKDAATPQLQYTYLTFIQAVASVIKLGLNLLGIHTLEKM